jgi:hypothetical protein
MKRSATITVLALAIIASPGLGEAGVGISPRLALPLGNFGDAVSTGYGVSVVLGKKVKDKPGRVGLTFISFSEGDFASATAIGAFAGYRRNLGSDEMQLYIKVDTNLYRISTDPKGPTKSDSEFKNRLTPEIGLQKGNLAVEADYQLQYDLESDWLGVNVYYLLGNVGQ